MVDRQLNLARGWHVAAAAASVLCLFATLRPDGLPGAVRILLTGFFAIAIVGHLFAAAGLGSRKRAARTISLVLNYLTFVTMAATVLHRCGVFTGLQSFSTGFAAAAPFIISGAIGVLWWWTASRIAERAPGRKPVNMLKLFGRILALGSMAVIAAFGIIAWIGHLDPAQANNTAWAGDVGSGLSELARRVFDPLTLGSIVLGVGAAWLFRLMWRPEIGAHFGATGRNTEALSGWLFVSPNVIGFALFFVGPLLFSLVISLYKWDTFGVQREFNGFGNYVDILSLKFANTGKPNAFAVDVFGADSPYLELAHIDWFGQHWLIGAKDREFWTALRNVIVFMVMAVPMAVIPALGLSTVLNSKLRGMKIFRSIFFVPSVAGVISVSLIWRDLFNSTVGWINYLQTRLWTILPGLDPPANGFQGEWFSSKGRVLLTLAIVFAWTNFGFNTVLYLAGHQSISGELYEAAELDGANAWKRFTRITVPQLRATTFYVVATTTILAMQLFDIVWVTTDPPGAPENASLTPVLHLYNKGFQETRQGYASAVAWVLFVLIFGLTLVQFRRQREEAAL